jgi:hypothetical protein
LTFEICTLASAIAVFIDKAVPNITEPATAAALAEGDVAWAE